MDFQRHCINLILEQSADHATLDSFMAIVLAIKPVHCTYRANPDL